MVLGQPHFIPSKRQRCSSGEVLALQAIRGHKKTLIPMSISQTSQFEKSLGLGRKARMATYFVPDIQTSMLNCSCSSELLKKEEEGKNKNEFNNSRVLMIVSKRGCVGGWGQREGSSIHIGRLQEEAGISTKVCVLPSQRPQEETMGLQLPAWQEPRCQHRGGVVSRGKQGR